MDMGLGKTACTLNEFIESGLGRLAVICPNSLKGSWVEAIKEWSLISDKDVCVWPEHPVFSQSVFIMNYEALLNSHDAMADYLQSTASFLALDEGHRIKNFNAKTTKYALGLAANATIRRELTGTPMTNNVLDLWSQLRYCGELNGVNPYAFRNRFAVMGGYMGKQVVGVKKDMMEELQVIMNRCSFRARKEDWTDLPMKIYPPPRQFDMLPAQAKLYKQMQEEFIIAVGREEISADMVISQLLKLQQISRGFVMNSETGEAHDLMPPTHSPSIKVLKDTLSDIEGKAIVFCHYRHSLKTLGEALREFSPAVIAGGIEHDSDAARRRFNEDSSCRVAVVQSATGSLGLTLLGGPGPDRCATTIFYENNYSLGIRRQAEDRNHRYGQDKPVVYVDFACSPIDRAIIAALQRKRELVSAVVDAVRVARTPDGVV